MGYLHYVHNEDGNETKREDLAIIDDAKLHFKDNEFRESDIDSIV